MLLPDPPVPVSATFEIATGDYNITFDQNIVITAGAALGVIGKHAIRQLNGVLQSQIGSKIVRCTTIDVGPAPPGTAITYDAVFGNWKDPHGRDVPSFAAFPATPF